MRTRRKKWADPYLEKHREFCLPLEEAAAVLARAKKPLYLEIGAGKGAFMRGMIGKTGGTYLCLERDHTAAASLARSYIEEGLEGAYLLAYDLDECIEELPKDSFARIFMNFPDPWPKRRHAKRRLCHGPRLEAIAALLSPGAELAIKTDSDVFYEYAKEQLPSNLAIEEDIPDYAFDEATDVQSEYERKKREAGERIHRLLLRRI